MGQECKYPNRSSSMNFLPDSAMTESPTAWIPRANFEKTPVTSPPENQNKKCDETSRFVVAQSRYTVVITVTDSASPPFPNAYPGTSTSIFTSFDY